jgi:hypothetical protein
MLYNRQRLIYKHTGRIFHLQYNMNDGTMIGFLRVISLLRINNI